MTAAQTAEAMSPELLKVVERARRAPEVPFHALAHRIDVATLGRAYRRLRNGAAVGVDGTTKEQYGQDLEHHLQDLHARLRAGRYRHQPIRRVHIPKAQGGTRPIGVSTTEDKIVQGALCEVLQAVYEQDFLDCSFGFRPGRSAHGALRAVNAMVMRGDGNWILEADISAFFDSVDRAALRSLLQLRIADGSLLRLIGKCLHVGVLDDGVMTSPEEGTVQGSSLSPLLGNVYLHYVLDRWFEREVRPRMRGRATLVRYADDFVIGFERRDDADRVQAVLPKRMAKYGLRLHPDKTRLLDFRRPPPHQQTGKGPGTLDFLGFTHHWCRSRRGHWMPGVQTCATRVHRAAQAVHEFCRRHRHEPVRVQHVGLVRRLGGHLNYFGVQGNRRRLAQLVRVAERTWRSWLGRRSQRAHMTWARYRALLRAFPLPRPSIRVRIWEPSP